MAKNRVTSMHILAEQGLVTISIQQPDDAPRPTPDNDKDIPLAKYTTRGQEEIHLLIRASFTGEILSFERLPEFD